MNCRHCNEILIHDLIDLGITPPSNNYLKLSDLQKAEKSYPLRVKVCENCWLVQTEDFTSADELFDLDYAYFSAASSSWLLHAEKYATEITNKLQLDSNSLVIEIASNDGYLLKNFVKSNIPCLGVEPTASTAAAAEEIGVPVIREFFGSELAKSLAADHKFADLIIGNNVYAHVPNINDFTQGMKIILKPGGTITLEFPHLLRLLEQNQFDTIYHEHFSYLSLYTVDRIFRSFGLKLWDVEELPTHGGSLRVYGSHSDDSREITQEFKRVLAQESKLQNISSYQNFLLKAQNVKKDLVNFLKHQRQLGNKVAAYGAAAKGNTLLNFSEVSTDLIEFVSDVSDSKQDKFMPGSRIPILHPSAIRASKPDFVLILPWNLATEICEQLAYIKEWDGKFVIAIPELRVL
jgi:hypothetical protein